MDNKAVYFLSNFHDPLEMTTVNRRQKDGSSQAIPCPTIVRDYNHHMGYVDKADQLKSTYAIDKKSKKWWLRIFWHLIDTAIVNLFVIYQEKGNKDQTLKSFRLSIVDGLIGKCIEYKKGRHPKPTKSNFRNLRYQKKGDCQNQGIRQSMVSVDVALIVALRRMNRKLIGYVRYMRSLYASIIRKIVLQTTISKHSKIQNYKND